MNIIGKFTKDGEGYDGFVQTLAFNGPVRLEPVKDKVSASTPDLRAFTPRPRSQGRVQIGAAWKERSEAGNHYLAVRFDEPSFPAPIVCRLIQLDGEEGYSLIWSRR